MLFDVIVPRKSCLFNQHILTCNQTRQLLRGVGGNFRETETDMETETVSVSVSLIAKISNDTNPTERNVYKYQYQYRYRYPITLHTLL